MDDTEPLPTDLGNPRPSWRGITAAVITGLCGAGTLILFIVAITI